MLKQIFQDPPKWSEYGKTDSSPVAKLWKSPLVKHEDDDLLNQNPMEKDIITTTTYGMYQLEGLQENQQSNDFWDFWILSTDEYSAAKLKELQESTDKCCLSKEATDGIMYSQYITGFVRYI